MGKRKHIVKQRMQMRQPARPKRVEPIQAKQTFADIVEVGSNLISPIPIEDGNIGKHQKHASLLQSLPIHSIKEESMRKLKDLEVGNDDENKYDDDEQMDFATSPDSKPRATMIAGHRYIPSYDSAISPNDNQQYVAWSENRNRAESFLSDGLGTYEYDDDNELVQWDYNQHSDNELFVDEGNDNNEENIGD